ncbi:MAG TPA: CoA transferase [Candidatus Dormibacteraeota bacterium]|nr:CoA transferase [Candidatus Dormibacteraeota bacterium]
MADLTVVALCTTRAALYAASLLRDLGASVAVVAELPQDAVVEHLARGCARLDETSSADAVRRADAVVVDAPDDHPLHRLTAEAPLVVRLRWSRKGEDGPASDASCQAAAGVCDVIGEPGRAPLALPYSVGEYYLGAHGAAALVAASLASTETAARRYVEIALDEVWAHAVGSNGMLYSSQAIPYTRAGRRAPGSGGPYPYGIFPVEDGQVCLIARTARDFKSLVRAMGNPAWAELPRYRDLRAMGREYPDEVDALLLPWLAKRSRDDLSRLAYEFGFPCAPVRTPREALRDGVLAEQHFWTDRHGVRWPGPLVRRETWQSAVAGFPAPRRDRAAAGLRRWRVLDLSWV